MALRRLAVAAAVLVLATTACGGSPDGGPDADATALTPCEDTRRIDEAWGDHLLPGDDTDVWVIGDSWTMGWPLEDPTTSWVSTFAEETGYTVHVDGWSASGYTVSGMCEGDTTFPTRVAEAAAQKPDLIVIQGGLNDAGVRESDLADAVAAAVSAAGETDVVLLGPPLAPVLDEESVREVDEVLSDAEGGNVRHVSGLDWRIGYFPDGAHPSSEGAKEYGELAAHAVRDAL